MISCLHSRQLCQIRSNKFSSLVKGFNRNSRNSKWPAIKNSEMFIATSESVSSNVGMKSLIKPFIFTVSFSGSCFVAASIWQYENMRTYMRRFSKSSLFDSHVPRYKRGEIRRQLHTWWHNQSEGQKVASCIIGINLCVFLLWKVPYFFPTMGKYFCSSPALKSSCLPMFLSTFSHYSFLHLAANMYVLYSFSTTAITYFGKEQFVALYCSAGVISSFTSYAYKVFSGRLVTSLGASGALMAILSSMCFQYPDIPLQIVFFPFFTFSAGAAIKAIMAVDVVGLFAKWKLFDHAAHLGGAVWGITYLNYGREYIWDRRERIFMWYHNIRERNE
ncbi:presenilins-associated rhomboid-like protein, mitochondrial [Uloborus diversus]|uniref:presenilins-associated rhomboid-like protein, mitochondrial n=1 Tax=Uloborus diversus TaxID=327109 RepID=UPI0024099301|nr:presenilins-associated rhomboid-like protein, mitochondrial [Uloborus diversus]